MNKICTLVDTLEDGQQQQQQQQVEAVVVEFMNRTLPELQQLALQYQQEMTLKQRLVDCLLASTSPLAVGGATATTIDGAAAVAPLSLQSRQQATLVVEAWRYCPFVQELYE